MCTCIHFLDRACVHIQNLCVCWICTWRQRQHEIGQTKFKTYFLLDRGGHRTGHRTVAPWKPPFGLESKNLEGGRSPVGPPQQFQSGSSKFLKREDNSGDLLGTFWQEKSVNDRAKGHLLSDRASPGINYPTPSFLHSGASMRMTNADSANDNNRERQRGRKVLCTYRPDAVSSESPELQYITGYGVNCLQPGSDLQELHRNAQTTATKSGSFPLQSARPLT